MKIKKALIISIDEDNEHLLKFKMHKGLSGEDLNAELKDIANSDFVNNQNPDHKMYFTPGCQIPRVKVREYFKCSSKITTSEYVFVNKKVIETSEANGFIQHKHLMSIPKEYWNDEHENSFGSIFYRNDILIDENIHFQSLYKSLIVNVDYIFITAQIYSKYNPSCAKPYDFYGERIYINRFLTKSTYNHDWKADEERFIEIDVNGDFAKRLYNDEVYFDSSLLPFINKDNLAIDANTYGDYIQMANSDDPDTISLMMELISNCDYKNSILYLIKIIKRNGYKMLANKAIDHVNFKSLLNFLNLSKYDLTYGLSLEKASEILKDHNIFTRANTLELSLLFADSVKDHDLKDGWSKGPVYTGNL